MFKNKIKQNFRVIAVIEELDDVSRMLKEYFDEYGYKAGIVTKLEVNIPYEIAILHIDPNSTLDLKGYKIETLVLNIKNTFVYRKEIFKLCKSIVKTGSIVAESSIFEKIEKKIPKNILTAKIDMTPENEKKPVYLNKYIGFYAQSITKSLYKYTDSEKGPDKVWKINSKYSYRMESLLFATVNSTGLIS